MSNVRLVRRGKELFRNSWNPRPRESVLETQLEDSVLVMPNGQDPWPEAQQLSSHYSPEHWGFRDSLESLVNTPGQEQVNVVETAAVGPERGPTNSCTLCSAEDHDCIQADCHEGATRSSPIDWSPLRELSTSVRSMRQELQSVQGDLSGQAVQRARDQEIASSERESNRRQLENLQGAVKELRDQQSQAHHSLDNAVKALRDKQSQANHDWDGAVEELRERYAHLNLVQNNEKRKVAWLTSRIDSVEDRLKNIDDSIKTSDGRTQGRFDSMATVMEQILQKIPEVDKKEPEEPKPKRKHASMDRETMDYSFTGPVQRNVSSVMTTPRTSSAYHTAPSDTQSYHTGPGLSTALSSEVFATPKPILSSTKKSQVVIQEEPMMVDSIPMEPSTSNSTLPSQDITKYIVDTMAKTMTQGLNSVIQKEDPKTKPPVFRGGIRDGSVDNWITLVRRYLEKIKPKQSLRDQSWSIIELLDGEARNYIMNKPAPEISDPEAVLRLLNNRFGTGASKALIRTSFASRMQKPEESLMQYLDALESLRSKGFPDESTATRRYEIMQRFIKGVRSSELNSMLSIKYSDEKFIEDPPTEEQLRFTVHEFSRMREYTHPRAKPMGEVPEVKEGEAHPAQTQPPAQSSKGCFNCGSNSHWLRECPLPPKERGNKQVNMFTGDFEGAEPAQGATMSSIPEFCCKLCGAWTYGTELQLCRCVSSADAPRLGPVLSTIDNSAS